MVRKNMSSFVFVFQEIGVQYHNFVVLKLSKEAFGCDRYNVCSHVHTPTREPLL